MEDACGNVALASRSLFVKSWLLPSVDVGLLLTGRAATPKTVRQCEHGVDAGAGRRHRAVDSTGRQRFCVTQ
eukprot:5779213-Amphidinium_carterae.2